MDVLGIKRLIIGFSEAFQEMGGEAMKKKWGESAE